MLVNETWAAIVEAEDSHGEGAEAHALAKAAAARALGDDQQAHIWAAAAAELHILHDINKQWARPRDRPLSGEPLLAQREGDAFVCKGNFGAGLDADPWPT